VGNPWQFFLLFIISYKAWRNMMKGDMYNMITLIQKNIIII